MSLTFTDVFCGAGGSSLGLTAAGLELRLAANHWDRAIETHAANFRDAEHLCFAAGTLVLTTDGPQPIEDVQPGQLVLTHRGRWRPVIRKFEKRDDTVVVKAGLHAAGTEVTANHEFWIRRTILEPVNPGSYRRRHAEPGWAPIGRVLIERKYRGGQERDALALPVAFGELPWEDPPAALGDPIEAWWVVGRWLGDGHASRTNYSVAISCGHHETTDLGSRLPASWRTSNTGTAMQFYCYDRKLYSWLVGHFGHGAAGKTIPGWALCLPEDRRRALLHGYLSADGSTGDGAVRVDTVSKPLAVAVRALAHSLGHKAGLHSSDRSGPCVIDGRTVQRRPAWTVKWQAQPTRAATLTDELHCWALIQSVMPGRTNVPVYTMEVAEDHSYVADGLVVKNCADVSNYDMRRLPSTDVLWASPICTENSPAGGRRRSRGQLALLEHGPVAQAGFERTRATFHDVIRATEVHRYAAVVVENVVEAADWELFDWWVTGMCQLRPGYRVQYLSVSSAHVSGPGNDPAPQWRDRLYLVFTRAGIPLPDLDLRPPAWCTACGVDVPAVQSWKRPTARRIGKYRAQYLYRCPNESCRHTIVEPYVLPAAAAIDWSDLGRRIGDRKRPLAAATMRRIRTGLELFAGAAVLLDRRDGNGPDRSRVRDAAVEPVGTVTARGQTNRTLVVPPYLVPAGGTWNDDPAAVDQPMRTRTARAAEGLFTPPVTSPPVLDVDHHGDHHGGGPAIGGPFVTMLRGPANRPTAIDEPVATVTTGSNHYLTTPAAFVTMLRANGTATGTGEPLATLAAAGTHHALTVPPGAGIGAGIGGGRHSLVIPYRRAKPKTTAEPLLTLATRDSAALVAPAVDVDVDVDDCYFRMLKPREHLRAQRIGDTYVVLGNQGEQTMQAGNAVSANVAQWIGERIAAALGGAT